MTKHVKTLFLGAAFAAALSMGIGEARAEYPDKPIKFINMYRPGGSTDVVVRILGRYLEPILGVPFVVQNIPGGGGAVGWAQAKDARPDGYTLTAFLDSLPVMEATGAVDFTQEDFDPVAVWGEMTLTVFTQNDGQFKSLDDYRKAAEERPGEIGLAMGYGTPAQFVSKIVEDAMGVDLNLVNVGGGAQKKAAVLGEHVEAGIEPTPSLAEPYRADQFDILAVLSEERLPAFPEIPTAKEQGVEAVHANTYAIVAPKGTPEDRVKILSDAIGQVVQDPEFLAENAAINFEITYLPYDQANERLETVRRKMLDIGGRLGF